MFVIEAHQFPYPILRPLTLADCVSAVRGDENAPVEAHELLVDYPLFAASITYGCYITPLSREDFDTFAVNSGKQTQDLYQKVRETMSADTVFLAEEDVADEPFISQQPT